MKSSLVILYHREPYDEVIENGKAVYREKKSPNGIVPTLKSFFADADQSTWVAWKQVAEDERDDFQERMTFDGLGDRGVVRRIPLAADEVKNFYHITSKEAFWPILHSFPWQFTYDSSDWENFQEINKKFAAVACEDAADDALIWVHDYNLWLAPYYIRQQKPNANIAFFHHTPFPSADIFNILPWRAEIVDSLLSCDLVGFHIPRYLENFVSAARGIRGAEVMEQLPVDENAFTPTGSALTEPVITTKLKYKGQLVNLNAFPVGTDPDHVRTMVAKPEVKERAAKIREEIGDGKLIVSAGRVDYVKGTKELLSCYERLLERRPELQGNVHLVLTAAAPNEGMRVYRTAKKEIEQGVGKINGRFGQLNWTPVKLFTTPLPFNDLMAVYSSADIAWITPLRDGLNLVAKEYVVANKGERGILVLSEFAGSAVELPDAILVNPYASYEMDKAIELALDMPSEEQKRRMGIMYESICRYDVQQWANHMFRAAKAAASDRSAETDSQPKASALV